ncbi:hypothetical protein H2199_006210 [Coniosporium tulheliwenetii]|uniref:Uncharacterized protein n=1 Tax=Coniosporium tulheliwenetii TaxID=3383036 RepID=A0ACC2YXB4_9PEZI|nr:hypothetical protein H2199_006210 [Cladosporium sp. JES 115]
MPEEQEPVLDDVGRTATKVAPTEEYGRRLRMLCSEMRRILGVEAAAGSCHPCAERWAVLYVSPDGKELRTQMRKDADDEDDTEEESPDSDSEDEGTGKTMDLESDYHQLKQAVTKLVQEYEIPKEFAPESELKTFSNRTSTHRRDFRAHVDARSQTASEPDRNPYHNQSQISSLIAGQTSAALGRHRSLQHKRASANIETRDGTQDRDPVLIIMLEAAMHQCQARSDYVNAHLYFRTLQQLRRLSSPSLTRNGYASLLNYFSRGPRDSLGRSASAVDEFEAWSVSLKQSQERQDSAVEEMMLGLKRLRDKMWYITDVRNSAGYDEARNIALALKIMGQPTRTLDGKHIQAHRPRNFSKTSSSQFFMKTEAQVLDIMAASPDHAGPNKLTDEQSDMTLKWLTQNGIENFCKGEERIHRFCLEIDRCVNKLVGDGILDGPVLWSSELYRRDKEILDNGRQKGDLFLTRVGTLSFAGDDDYEEQPRRSGLRTLDFAHRPSNSSLRSMSRWNGSQYSFDSGNWSSSRGVDIMDTQDYFGWSSPVLTIDSTATFWSPFQSESQAQSPSSATSLRPRTASSLRSGRTHQSSTTTNDDKRRFLLDLKQTLTSLLLSDLGTLVFGHGSETDAWFSGELGEECIQRKEEEHRRRKRSVTRKRGTKSARTKSRSGPLEKLGHAERCDPAAPIATLQHAGPENLSASEYSASSTDATTSAPNTLAAKKAGSSKFPYDVAFRRLLRKFATHPNPYTKLHALWELEVLIIASLNSSGRQYNNRKDTLPTLPQSPDFGAMPKLSSRHKTVQVDRAQNLEEAIANCEQRRSHTMTVSNHVSNRPAHSTFEPHSATDTHPLAGPPSTDMIVDVLQSLFRDASIRPKTLFRDLQYIASFVPAQTLDRTERGKAFGTPIADDIVALNTSNRSAAAHAAGSGTSLGARQQQPNGSTVSDSNIASVKDPLSRFSMADAATMLIITAKEGDAVAERELAIFYLTHPDLLPRTVLPLTRPRDVFKGELLQRDRKKEDPVRSDPMTMCVAQHWMEMSKRGGDVLATKYLRARDEMERIP